ncbi:cupin domain-containing protein [Azospirillum sp. ST 5-10]|uniref:cupin domain-containing protein n=1 Tax=unclassified Azospirillum TaxID=2630922 RepID=UPI003F4A7EEF
MIEQAALPLAAAMEALAAAGGPFRSLYASGHLEVELYRPEGIDRQTPHDRDELYVVISGEGDFLCGGATRPFGPGDVLVVPAHVEHRFVRFGADFATWVIFIGPPRPPAG